MKKNLKLRRILSFFLVIIILFSTRNFTFALHMEFDWSVYAFQRILSKEYFVPQSIMPKNINNSGGGKFVKSTFIPLNVKEATITEAKTNAWNIIENMGWSQPPLGELVLDGIKHDYTLPVKHIYRFTYDNDSREDFMPVWFMENYDKSQKTDPKDVEDLKESFKKALGRLQGLADVIEKQGEPTKPGDYHPTLRGYALNAIREWKQILFGAPYFTEFDEYLTREKIEASIPLLYDVIDYIESHRINEPEILDFEIGEYSGIVDKEKETVSIYIPKDMEFSESQIKITTPDWVIARHRSGDLKKGGKAIYSVKPIDATHEKYLDYYNIKDYSHMEKEWAIELLPEEPELLVNSVSYTSPYGERIVGEIIEDTITLDIPFEVDLDKLSIDVHHTGTDAYYIDKKYNEIPITDNQTINGKEIIGIKIKFDDLEKAYSLNISCKKSKHNEILQFIVEDYDVDIDHANGKIFIKIPYDTDVSALKPYIKVDYRTDIESDSGDVKDFTNPVIYRVISESGDIKEYKAEVIFGAPLLGNKILSFRVGAIEGIIEGNTIKLEVPTSADLKKIKPFIDISPKATVEPVSSEEVDFSKGEINYTVTAQNGEQRVYKVSIKHSQKEETIGPDEEYMTTLRQLRDNIYNKYKKETTSEDWEWMNIGFYESEDNGFSNGIRKTAENLPEKFNMYREIGELSKVKKTDFARFTMTLTAMGIDASNLEPFQIEGKPFKTNRGEPGGKEITDMVAELYNTSGGGINGAIFSLIALDMGEYSIPGTANLSRDDLVKILLNHEYGSDEFGIDMVAMLMQGLYPYQNHPIYGEEVKKKLDHGIELFLGSKSAKKVEPLNEDFLGISWGDANSESTSQVIIALCSMGIDPFSDYRFSRGPEDNMIVNWIDRFATNDLDGFGHTNNSYNFMGTYQGMYALQWYINFVENDGKPYSLYKDGVPFRFAKEFNKDCKIQSFKLLGKEGIIDHEAGIIRIELPEETSDEELREQAPIIEIPKGATITPKIGEKQNFSKEVDYIVTAEDGITVKKYTIIVEKQQGVKSSKKDILGGKIVGFSDSKIEIDQQKGVIEIELPVDTNKDVLKTLKVSFNHHGINIFPDETEPQDFTKGAVIYTVIAEDGTQREYKVFANIKKEAPYKFTKFIIRGVEGDINTKDQSIHLKLPFGSYIEEVSLNEAEFEPKDSTTSISPGLGESPNFSKRKKIQINPFPLPPEGSIEYDLDIEYVSSSGNSEIEKFSVPGAETTIKGNTIELKLPIGVDKYEIEGFVPEIKWKGKTIDPEPNGGNNSLKDYYKDYVLTDEDGNVNLYTVKVIESGKISPEKPSDGGKDNEKEEMKIESFKIKGMKGEVDNNAGIIYIELPYELDSRNIYPIIEISKGSSIYPNLTQPLDLRYSNKFILSNGKKSKVYTLIIRVLEPKPATKLWKYLDEYNEIEDYQIVY